MRTEYQRAYNVWNSMKNRCYNPNDKYYYCYGGRGVKMCDDWLVFQNFYEWYKENHYTLDGEYTAIDKDILGDGTIYSPETCIVVPFKINGMFVHKDNDMRGLQKRGKKYEVKVRNTITGKNEYIGQYDNIEIASNVYKECKKAIIKGVAEQYKDKIPSKVYYILINYNF